MTRYLQTACSLPARVLAHDKHVMLFVWSMGEPFFFFPPVLCVLLTLPTTFACPPACPMKLPKTGALCTTHAGRHATDHPLRPTRRPPPLNCQWHRAHGLTWYVFLSLFFFCFFVASVSPHTDKMGGPGHTETRSERCHSLTSFFLLFPFGCSVLL